MKKLLTLMIAGALVLSLAACGDNANSNTTDTAQSNTTTASTTTTPTPAPTPAPETNKGTVDGKYAVEIVSARTANDYQGNPAIIVTYKYTNNSSQNAALLTSVGANAFQNSVQCPVAVMMPDVMDAAPSTSQVMPGGSITAECAYSLKDLTNPVTVQVGPLLNINGTVNAQMVFNLQ